MTDIIKRILEELPKVITDAIFEAANIVLYSDYKFTSSAGRDRENNPRSCL